MFSGVAQALLVKRCIARVVDGSNHWSPVSIISITFTLVGLYELPEDDTIPDDEHFIEIEDTPGYQTAYSHLIYAGKRDHDPFAQVDNPKVSRIKTPSSEIFKGIIEQ